MLACDALCEPGQSAWELPLSPPIKDARYCVPISTDLSRVRCQRRMSHNRLPQPRFRDVVHLKE